MPPIGNVAFTIYYGTPFDDLNVPYNVNILRQSATKRKAYFNQFVWQNQFLAELQIDVESYDDIVGAQYVEITDNGTGLDGNYWFSIVGYKQIARRVSHLILLYDPLLSIGINNITNINGIIRRWSVNDDTHFNWILSNEPLDQIDDYSFSYFRYNPNNATQGNPGYKLVGFPYNMMEKPSILEYINSDGTSTAIYYPKLEGNAPNTGFRSSFYPGNNINYVPTVDGLAYYLWNPNSGDTVYNNFSYAVGLGFDIPANCYLLPRSNLFSFNFFSDGTILQVNADKQIINTGFSLFETGYNNNKASEIGMYFTLYNETTGERAQVENYNLTNSNLEIMANPYIDGYFMARLQGYYHDDNGLSGIVKSPGYRQFPLTGAYNPGQNLSLLNTAMEYDTINIQTRNSLQTADTILDNQRRSTMSNLASNAYGGLVNTALGNYIGTGGAVMSSLGDLTSYTNNLNTYSTTLDIISRNRTLQRSQLEVKGTLGQIAPPYVKMAGAGNFTDFNAYTFVLQKCSLSSRDREIADRFFTAYGYNVSNVILNSPSQLNTRSRFTFIMADDVNILSANSFDTSQLRDLETLNLIRDRFSAGLRIWQVTPDYNWSINNPIR